MSSLSITARSLIDPVEGMAEAVEARRWVLPLLTIMACVSLAAVALFLRLDASTQVVAELTKMGELSHLTEQELADKIATTERIALVGGVAKGVFLMPLFALLIAVALKVAAWLFGARADFARCFAAAVLALLPIGLYHLIYAVCAISQIAVTDAQLPGLVPSSLQALFPHAPPKLARVLSTVEFFNLWSAVLLGLGLSAASGMRRGRAVALGFVLYAMYAGIFLVGLPGMGGGGK